MSKAILIVVLVAGISIYHYIEHGGNHIYGKDG